jgi:hypothetical protein
MRNRHCMYAPPADQGYLTPAYCISTSYHSEWFGRTELRRAPAAIDFDSLVRLV